MDGMRLIDQVLRAAAAAGADMAKAALSFGEKSELNVDAGKMSLFRMTSGRTLTLTAYVAGSKGTATTDRLGAADLEEAAGEAVGAARSAPPDTANAIAPGGAPASFASGPSGPDRDAMYDRLSQFVAWAEDTYPKTKLEQCVLDFEQRVAYFGNSNGVRLDGRTGVYGFTAMFTTKERERTSSFNYSGAARLDLGEELSAWGGIDELMRQSTEQLDLRPVEGKFTGDIIVTPHCMGDFIDALDGAYWGGYPLIKGTTPWKDAVGTVVASPLLTLSSSPRSVDSGHYWTSDGFEARDWSPIDAGVFRGFCLDLYAANKTGRSRSPSTGGNWTMKPGDAEVTAMVGAVERGLLLCRFSGGQPSENGDFTGVAKNSYLIENGAIARPISETMVSGNVGQFLAGVRAVSGRQIDFGSSRLSWVLGGGVTISGR